MQYIQGQWRKQSAGQFSSLNPATQQPLWQGWAAGPQEVQAAVEAARAAFADWAHQDYSKRLEIVQRFKQLVESNKEELAVRIGQETGKPLWDARTEAAAVIGKLAFAEEALHERTGIKAREMKPGQAVIAHRPRGIL